MQRLVLSLAVLLCSVVPAAAGFDESINELTAPIATLIGQIVFFKIPVFGAQLPLVVLWLVVGAVFFTIYMGFINLRGFKHAIELVRGDYANPKDAGEVSHFQALATAVSGTVGIGNIGGGRSGCDGRRARRNVLAHRCRIPRHVDQVRGMYTGREVPE